MIEMKVSKLQPIAKTMARSSLVKRIGTKLAVNVLPKEVETTIGNSKFLFRPKIDGLWYLNYSDAEPGIERILQRNLDREDTFIDIGAYIGVYTILARNILGDSGKVIAFEPNPESYEMVRKNIELNRYENCIVENIAISNKEGTSKLYIGKYTNDSSSLFLANGVNEDNYVMIELMTLEKYCSINSISPDLIKIDTEGTEYKVLKGMQEIISNSHPKLLIEVHPNHLNIQGISLLEFFEFLKENKYKIGLVKEEGVEHISIKELVDLCEIGRKNKYGTPINQVIFCSE